MSADDRSSEDTRYTQREQAEAAARREMRSRGGGKVFVFDSTGHLLQVIRVAREHGLGDA